MQLTPVQGSEQPRSQWHQDTEMDPAKPEAMPACSVQLLFSVSVNLK